eukprot:comp22395_c0_seq1/m.33420 comp22395_c0_seq1/g.33420  ORF comp22395_c0_seq1/g.33420 comp22395_c0_seq1/m.33420 type:complete len:177 (-) comp22395_c0_seq1:498-1028(-)
MQSTVRALCAAQRIVPQAANMATVSSARASLAVRAEKKTGLFGSLLGFGRKETPAPAQPEPVSQPEQTKQQKVTARASRADMPVHERMEFVIGREIPHAMAGGKWETFSLDNPYIKFRILRAFEEEFRRDFGNHQLHTLKTLADVKAILDVPQHTSQPAFPSVDFKDLPANLSIQQ